MRHVVDWVLTQDKPGELGRGDLEPLLQALIASGDPELIAGAEEAGKALLGIWQMDERTRSSVYATAQSVVWPWADPGVASSSTSSDIDLDWLCSGPNTLYICAPGDDQQRLSTVFGGLLGDLIRQAFARVNAKDNRRLPGHDTGLPAGRTRQRAPGWLAFWVLWATVPSDSSAETQVEPRFCNYSSVARRYGCPQVLMANLANFLRY